MEAYVVTAYRWGFINNHHYIVCVDTDLQHCIDEANQQADYRGGKYGCVVKDTNGEIKHYAPSMHGETAPYENYRIAADEYIGYNVTRAIDQGWIYWADEGETTCKCKEVDVPQWLRDVAKKELNRWQILYPDPNTKKEETYELDFSE
jgi:hypothetical protein